MKKNNIKKENYVGGAGSFRGGPYGLGHKAQLATQQLNPATQRMEDQEQAEYDHNLLDVSRILDKELSADDMKLFYHDYDMQNPSPKEPVGFDSTVRKIGGSVVRDNTIVDPQSFIPHESPRTTDEYLIDDIEDDLSDLDMEDLKNEYEEAKKVMGEGTFMDLKTTFFSNPTNLNHDPKYSQETMGHTTIPTAVQVSSVGSGAVLFPKSFVPEDEVAKANKRDPITDHPLQDGQESIEDKLKDQEKAIQLIKKQDLQEMRKYIDMIVSEEITKYVKR